MVENNQSTTTNMITNDYGRNTEADTLTNMIPNDYGRRTFTDTSTTSESERYFSNQINNDDCNQPLPSQPHSFESIQLT